MRRMRMGSRATPTPTHTTGTQQRMPRSISRRAAVAKGTMMRAQMRRVQRATGLS